MIIALVALVLAPQAPDAGATVTKMLTKYHEAKTISGRITFTQSAASAKVIIQTEVAAQKPNLLYVRQTRQPASQGGANEMVAVSDGKKMGYPAPAGSATFLVTNPNRFFEPAKADLDSSFSAFSGMLLDRSLGVAIGLYSPTEIHATIGRLRALRISEVTINEKPVWRIDFQLVVSNALPAVPEQGWQARPEGRIPGVMTISKTNDLLGVAWAEKVGTKEQQVDVLSEWTVSLEVDKPIDQALFKVQ
ncbi:MAG: hypothetical protein M3R13_05320 [Armatimonadota bacterium]|nr:hypothetical protein [Armatimonadota bacterium]